MKKHPLVGENGFILGLGRVATGVGAVCGLGIYTLQELKEARKIGSKVITNDRIAGKQTTIVFIDEAAVTREIKNLQAVRRHMRKTTVEFEGYEPTPKSGAI